MFVRNEVHEDDIFVVSDMPPKRPRTERVLVPKSTAMKKNSSLELKEKISAVEEDDPVAETKLYDKQATILQCRRREQAPFVERVSSQWMRGKGCWWSTASRSWICSSSLYRYI